MKFTLEIEFDHTYHEDSFGNIMQDDGMVDDLAGDILPGIHEFVYATMGVVPRDVKLSRVSEDQWTAFADEQPDDGTMILCFVDKTKKDAPVFGEHEIYFTKHGRTSPLWPTVGDATHWMPVPQLPIKGQIK